MRRPPDPGTRAHRLPLLCALLLVTMVSLLPMAASASAATTIDARGTWDCRNTAGGTCSFTIDTEDQSSGAFAGRGAGNGYTWPVSGTITGSSFEMKHGPYDQLPSYVAYFSGTLSADGGTMTGGYGSGPCSSNPCTSPFTYMRLSGSSPTPTPTPTAAPTTTAGPTSTPTPTPTPPPGKRAAASVVACDLYNAEQPNAVFLCTASVGDASGQSPAKVPTGPVQFTINAGASGSFLGNRTASCPLRPSPSSPNVSFCSVNYTPPTAGIPIGSQPPIKMTYAGDATFGPSASVPRSLYAPCPPANLQTRAVTGPFPVATDVAPEPPTCAQAAKVYQENADACAAAASGQRRSGPFAQTSIANNPNVQFQSTDSYGMTLLKVPALIPRALISCAGVVSYGAGGVASFAGDPKVLTAQSGVGAALIASGVGSEAGVALEVSALVQVAVAKPVGRGLTSLGSVLIDDPPDRHYRTVAKVPRVKPVSLPAKTAPSIRRLAAFAVATRRFTAAADTMKTAVNRAGGAKRAHKKRFQGKQIRAALVDGRAAVAQLRVLTALEPAVAADVLAATQSARAVTADDLAKAAHATLPTVEVKLLKAYGVSAADVRAAMKTVKVGDRPAVISLSPLTASTLRAGAAVIALYAKVPQIRKEARLR